MTIAHIIDTTSIATGDLVAFTLNGLDIAGSFKGYNDAGELDVRTLAFGLVSVAHEDVTDIL